MMRANPQRAGPDASAHRGGFRLLARGLAVLGARLRKGFIPALVSVLVLGWARGASAQTSAPLLRPSAIAYDSAGNLYIADANRNQVFEATLAGALTVVAGSGVQGSAGDGGPALAAQLNSPQGLAFGMDGTLYIADTGNARIRALSAGTITTFAGTGVATFGGDGGPATGASFRSPTALAADASGALLVCDTADHRIRRISGGVIATFAGNGLQGISGDGGAATLAEFDSPAGLAVAADGRVFIADTHNQRVRVVSTGGVISTFAGTGQRGFGGDGGPASSAELASPRGLVVTGGGALLIADADDDRVRSVSASGVITTIAGTAVEGTSTDGAGATQASLHAPRVLAVSSFGMPAFADTLNGTVRVLTPAGTLFQPAALVSNRSSAVQASGPSSQAYGQGSVTVVVTGPVGAPEGNVSVSEGGSTVATAALANGGASLSLANLGAGTHALAVTYAGDGLNPAAVGGSFTTNVAPAPLIATANAASVPYGAPLPALTGTLTGVLPQDAGQVSAVFSSSASLPAPVGTYPIAVSLTGPRSGGYTVTPGPNSGSLQITQTGSSTLLSTVPQSYAGMPLRLSANVTSNTSGQPTGTVQFLDGSTVVAAAALVNGSASAVYPAPAAGTLNLTAQYTGDTNFQPSNSAIQTAVVGTLPDFAVSISGSTTASVQAGSVATYSLIVSAQPTPFTGIVTLSASGLPPDATVNFTPVQVVPGGSSATVMVSVQTSAAQVSLRSPSGGRKSTLWAFGGLAVFCFGLARRRVRVPVLLMATLFFCGCGARTVGEEGQALSSQGYTVTLTGTSTNLAGSVVTHTTPVTLTIQN